MSGPKALTCSAFNAALNTIFSLQNRIASQMRKLAKLHYSDQRSGLSADCTDFVEKNRKRANILCETYQPRYRGTGREMRTINEKTAELEMFLKSTLQAEKQFKKTEEDYTSYADYLQYIENSSSAFEEYKGSTLGFIEESVAGKKGLTAIKEIKTISLSLQPEKYATGFLQREEKCKQAVREQVDLRQASIDSVRVGVLDSALSEWSSSKQDQSVIESSKVAPLENERYQQRQALLIEIQLFIQNIKDSQLQEIYTNRLDKLIKSKTFTDPYFYGELFDELKKSEENRKRRQALQDMLHTLDEISFPVELQKQQAQLRAAMAPLLNQTRISSADVEEVREEFEQLLQEKAAAEEALALQKRQNRFLKENLIAGLESLGYKVMSEAQVVDFETVDDFILDIPEQDNFLNVRFSKEKNDFLYNFLIPEKKESLDVGQTRQKLEEMQTACDDFKQALSELQAVGVECEITRDIPVSESAIIRIPERMHKRLIKTGESEAATLRTKYLNQDKE